MCGQVGVIFGRKRRRAEEREHLARLFTRLLLLSEELGPHATGAAWLNRDGEYHLFKRPLTATQFINDKGFGELLAGIDNRTTVLLGHTRWRTRGDEQVNQNNHPIRAGKVIGTHNGTIYNADYLFRRYKLPRFAEVDSELLLRLADNAFRNGRLNMDRFKKRLRRCRGQITAVMACRTEPGTVFLLKGNKPLEAWWNKRMRAVLYASDPLYLDAVLTGDSDWREITVPPMTMMVFRHEDLFRFSVEPFTFLTQESKGRKHDTINVAQGNMQ